MKKRMIALLLLFVIALSACAQTLPPADDAEPEAESREKPTAATETTKAPEEPTEAPEEPTEATEVSTEATEEPTEATEEPEQDLDIGTVDGNAYRNETLGITCDFPSEWYIYNETDLAALNNLVEIVFDSEMLTEAIESGDAVVIFCASQPGTYSSVNITVSKNQTYGFSEEAIIKYSIPIVKEQLEQSGMMQNIVCEVADAEFCGRTHKALEITCDVSGMQLYETLLYLSGGEYCYTITASTMQKTTIAEILNMFEAID